jgi:AcrR family transcriptional regulator
VSETEVPVIMELAWGVRSRPARGPKRALTLERIVAAGIAVAGEDGLPAVSMARVAKELGASTMALYRYVEAKEDLLELMVDTALGLPPDAVPGVSWRVGLRRWAEGIRDAYRAHPWTLKVPIASAPLGPNNVRWLENGLAAQRETGLSGRQKLSVILLLSGFVRNEETLTTDILARLETTGRPPADYGRQLAALADPADFPHVHASLAEGAFDDADTDSPGLDDEFEFGLECILDGVAVLVEAAQPHPVAGRPKRSTPRR